METKFEYIDEDYAQSANTLFHFMKEPQYLKQLLLKKAIVPRYCMENVEYLNLSCDGVPYEKIYVLQKCFCDIPLHKLTQKFKLTGVGEAFDRLSEEDKNELSNNNTHLDFYGKYAISFSKKWGELNNLQPIHYLNVNAQYAENLSDFISKGMEMDDLPEEFVEDILERISFLKPLRGLMQRTVQKENEPAEDIYFYKNFHDEQEWRYVPARDALSSVKKDAIIANPYLMEMYKSGMNLNEKLYEEKYQSLWLRFKYDDIRYIVVPDSVARIDLIQTIMDIPEEMFEVNSNIFLQKSILVSKILVLEEIERDW